MPTYADIERLTFGKSIAESEAKALQRYFVSTQAYINAKTPERRKTYYIGQRGAGKSALLNQLATEFENEGDNITLRITPHDFSYELFKAREHDYVDVRSVYAAVWHYTLMIQLFKQTVDYFGNNPHLKTNRENVGRLRKYLVSKGLLDAESILEIFFSFLTELTAQKNINRLQNISSDGVKRDKHVLRILYLTEIASEVKALETIAVSHPIYIFIDELDTGWNDSKEAQNFIFGLFYAVRELKKLQKVTVFISLRSDMYYNLRSILPDPEKMRDDIERFSWNLKTLRTLIGNRILAYWPTDELKNASAEEAISTVFEEHVLNYIISHSLHRPREIIQFCNEALDAFRLLVLDTGRLRDGLPTKIALDVTRSVQPTFSANRFDDLCVEYKDQYPGLRELLSSFENAPEYYFLADFKAKVEEAMLAAIDRLGGTSWIAEYLDKPTKLIEILFEIGFIKLYSQQIQQYLAYYETSFLSIENIQRLKIHEVFTSALKTTR